MTALPSPPPLTARSAFGRDLVSAYFASASRVLSWVVVSAVVYRVGGAGSFAILALIRGTLGLLAYVAFGIGPALVHHLASASASEAGAAGPNPRSIYSSGVALTAALACVGVGLVALYAWQFTAIHDVGSAAGENLPLVVGLMGLGLIARLASDTPAAVLQVRGRVALDNTLQALADLGWAVIVIAAATDPSSNLAVVALAFAASNVVLATARFALSARLARGDISGAATLHSPAIRRLLAFGGLLTLANLADFLYAPTDYILINALLGPDALASYAPAMQIDAGLFVLVGAVAAVLMPRAALAHAGGDRARLRADYIRCTLVTAAVLAAGAAAILLVAPQLFQLWLGEYRDQTRQILPLVLLHTVIGGSSSVGRAVMLGMGQVRAYTAAALACGALNVLLGYLFVAHAGLGLPGIAWATVIAVSLRSAWMPWHILRSIRS